jgi:hypothetical protein
VVSVVVVGVFVAVVAIVGTVVDVGLSLETSKKYVLKIVQKRRL